MYNYALEHNTEREIILDTQKDHNSCMTITIHLLLSINGHLQSLSPHVSRTHKLPKNTTRHGFLLSWANPKPQYRVINILRPQSLHILAGEHTHVLFYQYKNGTKYNLFRLIFRGNSFFKDSLRKILILTFFI